MDDLTDDLGERLLEAVLAHVPFDGWTEPAFRAAIADLGVSRAAARAAAPRGALDLAVAWHRRGDAALREALSADDLATLRIRDRVAKAVRMRIEIAGDREVLRRSVTLFALPHLTPEGTRLIWETADTIWTALGDTSDDLNWYTKRTILSGVYSSTVLYWLGDSSPDSADTWAFLDRRIDGVMQFERVKAAANRNPVFKTMFAGPIWLAGRVRAPRARAQDDLPGRWAPQPPAPADVDPQG